MDRLANWSKSHPGFYVSHNERGVTLQIEVIDRDGNLEIETLSVWNIEGARISLGY